MSRNSFVVVAALTKSQRYKRDRHHTTATSTLVLKWSVRPRVKASGFLRPVVRLCVSSVGIAGQVSHAVRRTTGIMMAIDRPHTKHASSSTASSTLFRRLIGTVGHVHTSIVDHRRQLKGTFTSLVSPHPISSQPTSCRPN